MSKEKAKTLLLLDLSTFALMKDNNNGNRKDFEMACKLAEKQSLPQLQMYKDFISSVEEDE
jgi:D-Tyr-tRNAtyr deacylase